MSADERIHNALHEFRRKGIDLDGFEIHMGMSAYRELLLETVIAAEGPTYRGLPVRVNLNMADGEIVLRYEVKA